MTMDRAGEVAWPRPLSSAARPRQKNTLKLRIYRDKNADQDTGPRGPGAFSVPYPVYSTSDPRYSIFLSFNHRSSLMNYRVPTIYRALIVFAAVAGPLAGQGPVQGRSSPPLVAARITPREIDAHLRFLSSDLLEGRAPATRGGRLAAEYIASQLLQSGVQPGVKGSYFQNVPIDIVAADSSSIAVKAGGRSTKTLELPD